MSLHCRKEPCYAAVLFLFLFVAVDAFVPNCVNRFQRCECHAEDPTYYDLTNLSNSTKVNNSLNCVHFGSSRLSWDAANERCQFQYSNLLYLIDELVSKAAELRGVDVVWLGIRRVAGFYVNLTSVYPDIFKVLPGEFTWGPEEPLYDCVALNLTSRPNGKFLLVTKPCDTQLSFICQNDGFPTQLVKSLACPENGYFVYQSSLDSPKCTLSETIYFDANVTETVPDANQNISLYVELKTTFPLSSYLMCELFSGDGEPLTLTERHSSLIQWFKNGIPIARKGDNEYYFQTGFYPDPLKINVSNPLTRQGRYSCGVYLPGFPYMLRSEEVDYFYSEHSTYLLVLEGPKAFINYQDFSQGKEYFRKIKNSMNMFLLPPPLKSVGWDFQNASVISKQDVRITLLLFTPSDDQDLFNLLQSRNQLRKFWKDYVENKGGWPITSLETYLADTCLDLSEVASGKEWFWQEAKATGYGVSEPMCLNDLKLVTRSCRSSLIDGAHWMPFDYSACTTSQPWFQDILPICSQGNYTPTPNLCYSLHLDEATFSEALDICHGSSGHLMDSNFLSKNSKIFEHLGSQTYWISDYSEETSPEGEYILSIEDVSFLSKGLPCTATSLSNISFVSEDCQRKLPFICIQTIHIPASSILYSLLWHRFPDNDSGSCYSFQDEKLTWKEAESACQHSPSSSLLSINDEEEYGILRLLMSSLKALKDVKGSSWMSLVQEDDSFHWSDGLRPTFVDWSQYTDFSISPSAAGVLNKSKDASEWILMHPDEEISFICEMRDCKDTRPYHVYLEDLLPPPVSTGRSSVHLSFKLLCSWSGWSVSETVSWFKDGVQLLDGSTFYHLLTNITIDRGSLEESHIRNFQGYYWCSLHGLDGKVEESSRLLKKVPGFTTFVVKVVSEFLSPEVPTCLFLRSASIHETFQVFNETIQSKGLLHNVTCNSTHVVYYAYLYATNENLWEDLEAEAKRMVSSTDTLYDQITNYPATLRQIEVRSTDFCPEERVVLHDGTSITWPAKDIGGSCTALENYVSDNGTEMERQCLGDFYSGAYWGPMPEGHVDSTRDATLTLNKLAKITITKENVLNSSQNLEQLTSTPEDLTKEDVRYIAKILKNIGNVPVLQPEVLPSVVKTVDSIIEAGVTEETSIPNRIDSAFNAIISRLPPTSKPVKIVSPHISLSRLPLSEGGRTPLGGALEDFNINLTTLFTPKDLENRDAPLASILLPEHLVNEVKGKSNESSPLVIKSLTTFYGQETSSPIIEAFFVNYVLPKDPLYPRVKIEFSVPEELRSVKGTFQCVFWDHALNDRLGGWSYKGCTSEILNTSRVLCSCDHLTAFSLLFDPEDTITKEHAVALGVISIIGCTFSIIGLVLTMLTFCLFRSFRKRMQLKALFNLSLSLTLFLVLFLAGFTRREGASDWQCLGVGLSLHYLLLATFAWMVVEAYLQYLSLVKVFGTYIPRFIQKAMLFAWGVPLLAVVAVLSVDHTLYYKSQKYCWVGTAEAFYYAVATPVLLMLAANFVLFGRILYSNTCGRDSKILRSNQNQRQEALTRARAIFSVSILLGLSWIFGFLSLISEDSKLLFSYLFALTTTSQGFFIFIFYVFRHHSVRLLWLSLVLPQYYSVDVSRCTSELLKASHVSSKASREPYVHFNANFS